MLTRSQVKARTTRQSSKSLEISETPQPHSGKLSQLRSPLKEVNTTTTDVTIMGSPASKRKVLGVDYSTPTQTLPSNPSTPARRKQSHNIVLLCDMCLRVEQIVELL